MRKVLLAVACIVALGPLAQGATAPSLQSGGSAANSTSGLKASDLLARIDKALARLPKPSAYLYETNTVPGAIASTWTEMTAGILGTRDLRVAYDSFYQTSVEYSGMVAVNLLRARRAAQNNDVEAANRLYQAALRYESQFYLNDKAAIETFNGNIDAVTVLTKGIYQGSKAAAIYGSSMVMGPVGSRVVDTVFGATDFAVEFSENGLASATKQLVADKLTEMIFSQATVATLGGKTMKDALERGVTKTLGNPEVYKIVREVVSKPGFAKAFMSFMGRSGAYAISNVTEYQVNKIVMAIVEASASKLPPITDCGPSIKTDWYKVAFDKEVLERVGPLAERVFLQAVEVLQATGGGYSFNTACQAHDRCYGDCKTGKQECDDKLLADAKLVCDSSYLKYDCLASAKVFQLAVSKFGGSALSAARANCPANSNPAEPKVSVAPQKWEREWKGTQQRGKATQPVTIRLRRDGNRLEGWVTYAAGVHGVRGSIKSDGAFRLTSRTGLVWYGKISARDSISGRMDSIVEQRQFEPDLLTEFDSSSPFKLDLVKVLPEGSTGTTKAQGPSTTSKWEDFIGAFRLAIKQQNVSSLRPMIADQIFVGGTPSCLPACSPREETLATLRKGGWREIATTLANGSQKKRASPWGHSYFLIVDERKCDGCQYHVMLGFEQDDNSQWHWTELLNPGDPGGGHEELEFRPDVTQAFLRYEARMSPRVRVLGQPIVASKFALLGWADENMGGQAIMKYAGPEGWRALLMDSGVMQRAQLIAAGVPASIAKELCDLSRARDKSPNQDWRKQDPDAC